MNTFPISLRGTTPSVGVGWVGSGEIERRENRETRESRDERIERRDGTGQVVW